MRTGQGLEQVICSENLKVNSERSCVHGSTGKAKVSMSNLKLSDLKDAVRYFEDDPRVRIVGFVYETDDYSFFEKMKGNREVKRINRIKTSMRKHGFLNIPISVNLLRQIGDGQHRERAAEDLNIPVKFVVEPNMTLEETIDVNVGQENWGTSDHIHSNATLNNVDYARFEQLANTFPFANPSVIYAAMGGNITGGGIEAIIRDKRLKCSEEQYEEATKMLAWLSTFNDLVKENKMRGAKANFYIALMFVRNSNLVNTQILSKRIRQNFFAFGTYFSSPEEVIRCVENAYNFKVSTDNKVYLVDAYRKAAAESLSKTRFNGENK